MIQCRSAFPPARIGAQLLLHPPILIIENITSIRFPIWRLRGRCEKWLGKYETITTMTHSEVWREILFVACKAGLFFVFGY